MLGRPQNPNPNQHQNLNLIGTPLRTEVRGTVGVRKRVGFVGGKGKGRVQEEESSDDEIELVVPRRTGIAGRV